MNSNKLDKLKASLGDAINEWLDAACTDEEWDDLDTHVSDRVVELMRDSAFNILLAQSDLTKYYTDNEMFSE